LRISTTAYLQTRQSSRAAFPAIRLSNPAISSSPVTHPETDHHTTTTCNHNQERIDRDKPNESTLTYEQNEQVRGNHSDPPREIALLLQNSYHRWPRGRRLTNLNWPPPHNVVGSWEPRYRPQGRTVVRGGLGGLFPERTKPCHEQNKRLQLPKLQRLR